MGKGSKTLYWAGAGAALLLVMLLALAVIVPRLVDSAWLKETIRTEVAKQIKGDFDFQKAELSILPAPSVSLQRVSITIPDAAQINLDTLKVYPKLLTLLAGNMAIAKIIADKPVFSVQLSGESEKKTDQEKDFSFSEALDNTSAKLTPVLSAIQGLQAGVHKGTLRLFKGDEQVFLFEGINGSFAAAANSLTVTISCRSNIWDTMELHSVLVPGAKEANGKISLENINAKVLADYFLPGKLLLADGSISGLEANFIVSPETGLTADIKNSGVFLALSQRGEKITAKIENLNGSIQYSDQISSITVADLSLSSPQVHMSGSFKFDRSIPHASLDINAHDSDITGVHEILPEFIYALYGDLPVLQDIFAIIRGGKVSLASFHVEGKSPAELGIFEAMLIQAHLKDGEILLSDLGLDLQGVTGEVTIAEGILEGKNLRAKLGKSTGSDGNLKLGLVQKESTPFHLDLNLDADLSAVPPLLKQLVPKKQVLEYLSLIETVEGTAQGRLTLGESLESVTVRAEMDKVNLLASYTPIPFPIILNGGRILYDGLKTESFNLQGKVGNSTFSDYSSRMNFEGEPSLEVESGSFHLVLDEIFPWLATDKRLAEELQDIKKITGIADVSVKNIKGPLLQPANLQYELHCDFRSVDLTAAYLPGPLAIKAGQANIVPDKITFENLQADLLDSSLTYSGVLQNFITGKTNTEIIITDAEIGPEVNTWLSGQIKVPEEYIFRTPLLVSRANVKWTRKEMLDLQGDFSLRKGPIFSIDVLLDPDELLLRSLALKSGDEQAKIKLALKRREISAEFLGSLSKNTIDNILLHNELFPEAWIEGDIKFDIYLDSPATSVATGNLDGGGFIFPWKPDKPIRLQNFSLLAADKTLTLNSVEAAFEGTKYDMKGRASLTQEHLSIDLDTRTDSIELDKILEVLKDEAGDEKETVKRVGKSWDLAVQANITLHAGSLQYRKYTWKPFESHVTYENSILGIEVLKAELCNISTPGKISFHDGQTTLDFNLEAEGEEFSKVLICLEGGQKQMTGLLDLKASIAGQGTRETLANSLQGKLQYSAKDGFIYQDAQAAKLLSFLNITEMFQGKIPDLRTAGFHYDSLIVKGTMDKGILTIAPAKLEAPFMQIAANGTIDIPGEKVNLQVLVAPLQTVNKIQDMLPVIRSIIPSSLAAVPVEVSGDFSDIKVRALSMSAITTRVFDVMMDALSSPVRMLEGTPQK